MKTRKFRKVVEYNFACNCGFSIVQMILLIIAFPIFCIPIYIKFMVKTWKEDREVYWEEEK